MARYSGIGEGQGWPENRVIANFVNIRKRLARSRIKSAIKAVCAHCIICGKEAVNPTFEHVIPKSEGGERSIENGAISCMTCNNVRGDKKLIKSNHSQNKVFVWEVSKEDFDEWRKLAKFPFLEYKKYQEVYDKVCQNHKNFDREIILKRLSDEK